MSRYIEIEKASSYVSRLLGVLPMVVLKVFEKNSIDIVCCKECKYGQDDLFHMFCAYHHHKTYADDFCSYGEREGE